MQNDWAHITDKFQFEGRLIEVTRCTLGHINDTFELTYEKDDGTSHRYILQRINHHVFRQPEQVMENIEEVTKHLRNKIDQAGGNPERETINLIPTVDGRSWYRTDKGDYWRGTLFIEGAKTYNAVEDPRLFRNAGKAFGQFQMLLSDFPAETLHETIPQFHDTQKRYNDLMEAVEKDVANRVREVRAEIEFVEQRAAEASVIVDLLDRGDLPLRVIHNDTKLNNVMIDDISGEAICVLDLDTVMPGSPLYDFGDAIRFGASTAAEDETDLSRVAIDLALYRQFTRGYLTYAHDFLTPNEYKYLAFSAKLITYELGMRFLTDHLNGDEYFKIHRPGHNLDRARTQFKLVADMEDKMDVMESIIDDEKDNSGAVAAGE